MPLDDHQPRTKVRVYNGKLEVGCWKCDRFYKRIKNLANHLERDHRMFLETMECVAIVPPQTFDEDVDRVNPTLRNPALSLS
ncbi:hypothetical protein K449DRAFT_37008 [Hypoxylon sp. EC38]|nr:hypothetical protein K449DRAFT_37008 [Hypoxylon sp. EC38]